MSKQNPSSSKRTTTRKSGAAGSSAKKAATTTKKPAVKKSAKKTTKKAATKKTATTPTKTMTKKKTAPAPASTAPAAPPPSAPAEPVKKKPTTKKPKKAPAVPPEEAAAPAPKPVTEPTAPPPPAEPAPEAKPKAPDAETTPESGATGDGDGDDADRKKNPKGITIVPSKKPRRPKERKPVQMPAIEPLLKPGAPKPAPLIPSGPSARIDRPEYADADTPRTTTLSKKELERYRDILLEKRKELLGDVAFMEDGALKQSSGSLSHSPQHMADQGSDTYDQSLSLDLAAVDRSLIREIDDALNRIEARTFGVCEITGQPIGEERLAELPWTRYSIEGARELERRGQAGR